MQPQILHRPAPVDPGQQRIPNRARHLTQATRQLATLLRSGIPIGAALEVLAQQSELPEMAEIIQQVASSLQEGLYLSQAMGRFPLVFPEMYVTLVKVGEATGLLVSVIDQLALVLEREERIVRRVQASLTYPAFVLSLTMLLTILIFYFVMPSFVAMFEDLNLTLPWITRCLVTLTKALQSPGFWLIALGTVLLVTERIGAIWVHPRGKIFLYSLLLKVPIVGGILHIASLARFSWVMEATIASGTELTKCLTLASRASGNPIMAADGPAMVASIQSGETLTTHFSQDQSTYPRIVSAMIKAGEESSSLNESFAHLAAWFDQELGFRLDLLSAVIEPLLMAIVAVIVGTILVSLFLPLYGMLDSLGS